MNVALSNPKSGARADAPTGRGNHEIRKSGNLEIRNREIGDLELAVAGTISDVRCPIFSFQAQCSMPIAQSTGSLFLLGSGCPATAGRPSHLPGRRQAPPLQKNPACPLAAGVGEQRPYTAGCEHQRTRRSWSLRRDACGDARRDDLRVVRLGAASVRLTRAAPLHTVRARGVGRRASSSDGIYSDFFRIICSAQRCFRFSRGAKTCRAGRKKAAPGKGRGGEGGGPLTWRGRPAAAGAAPTAGWHSGAGRPCRPCVGFPARRYGG